MARVIILDNPFNHEHRVELDWNGPYCSNDGVSGFLNQHYPEGFPGTHRTFYNREYLPVENYDVELKPDDEVVLLVTPGGFLGPVVAAIGSFISAAGAAIASSAVLSSLAVGLALTAASYLLTPKPGSPQSAGLETPQGLSRRKAESVYNLATPVNQTRLGDPIPVAYGKNRLVPDYIAEPYSYYSGNDQYVKMLFCLGQGVYDVEDIFLSDTNVEAFGPGVISTEVFYPEDHGETIGTIDASWINVAEDVYVSDEVANIELEPPDKVTIEAYVVAEDQIDVIPADRSKVSVGSIINLTRILFDIPGASDGVTITDETFTITDYQNGIATLDRDYWLQHFVYGSNGLISNFDKTDLTFQLIRQNMIEELDGKAIELHFNWNGTTYVVEGTYKHQTFDGRVLNYTITPVWAHSETVIHLFGDEHIMVYYPFTPSTAPLKFTTPYGGTEIQFAVCNEYRTVDTIQFDYVFPAGLFEINEITGDYQGYVVNFGFTIQEIDNFGNPIPGGHYQNIPRSIGMSDPTPIRRSEWYSVPRGRYRAGMYVTTAKSNNARISDRLYWTGLNGYDYSNYNQPGYGYVTLLAVVAKASSGLNTNALNRISVTATRKLDGESTRLAQEAFRDVLTSDIYGAGRPSNEIIGSMSGNFDAVFDFDTTVWEALNVIAQANNYSILPVGNALKVKTNEPSSAPRMSFTEGQTGSGLIVDGTLVRSYALGNRTEEDGIEVEYRDPLTYLPEYVIYPDYSVRPREVKLFGVLDRDKAKQRAELIWKQQLYNRFVWSFDSELDALLLEPGDTISVQPLDGNAVTCVVSEVTHKGGFQSSVIAYEYDSRVYS